MERLGRNLHVTSCDCVGECTRGRERDGELDLHDLAMYISQMVRFAQARMHGELTTPVVRCPPTRSRERDSALRHQTEELRLR